MGTADELKMLQALPLEIKIEKTKLRIKEWVDYFGEDGVYVSVSGGKDSQVLSHIVKSMYQNIPCVFINTGLEYDSVRMKGKEISDVVLQPDMNFLNVLKKYGYPIISKEVSQAVDEARRYMKALTDRQTDRQTDDSVCLSDSRFLWNRSESEQRQRIIQGIKKGEYP